MSRFKYIVTDKYAFAIFSETCTHEDMAKGMYGTPVGAGFCTIAVGFDKDMPEIQTVNVHCFGESESLNLKSRENDEKIINNSL
jgi:hypothetical protein